MVRLKGHLDQISDSLCSGWLFSPDAPARRFDIGVYRDGVLAGTGQTALPRGDVLREYPQAGVCGFAFPLLPTDREAAGLTHLSIRLAGSPHELFEGPFLLGSCAQAIGDLCSDEGDGNASAIRREALASWLHHAREGCEAVRIHARPLATEVETVRRLAIVIPCFGDVAATRRCFDSVLRARRLGRDLVVIVNDNPDDVKMGELIDAQERHPDVFVLRNDRNLGFVLSVNRAMAFVRSGDVLLLNADTEVFAGSFDEMVRVLYSAPDIGTVTALSSNATLFTYPHPDVVEKRLDDVAWAELAAVALRENAGTALPIPTTHGFCMLIRRALLGEIGLMDTAFGRGYGEENDFSLRATDRGWRHVVAGGVLVRHDEAGSFGAEKVSFAAAKIRQV
jgi:GT2 family glycosyltransferase